MADLLALILGGSAIALALLAGGIIAMAVGLFWQTLAIHQTTHNYEQVSD